VELNWIAGITLAISAVCLALVCRTGVRGVPASRWVIASLSGITVLAVCIMAGLHHCDQGTPYRLSAVFGVLAFILVAFIRRRGRALLGLLLIACLGTIQSCYVSGLYHSDEMTGNPRYGSGSYWHSFLTGAYPRRSDAGPRPPDESPEPTNPAQVDR
jgi:hypothetical protein